MAGTGAPTIHDVARASGVSISTVSRALGRPERVNDATRELVLRAATDLGYAPNPQARSLLSGRSSTVMLLLPDVTNPFFFGLIRGVQRSAAAAGYGQVVVDTDESPEVEAHHLLAARKSVDGVVLATSRLPEEELARAAARVPLVTINRPVPGAGSVVVQTPAAYGDTVELLAGLGHRSLVYVSGPAASWSGRRRWAALSRAARRYGLAASRTAPVAPTREGGAAVAGEALATGASAVLTFNDLQAIGLLAALADRGVRVPGEVSVVGCDDIFGADFCAPALTTLAAPVEEAGRRATALLLDRLIGSPRVGDGTAPEVRLPARLVVRDSTGPAPVSARRRAAAAVSR